VLKQLLAAVRVADHATNERQQGAAVPAHQDLQRSPLSLGHVGHQVFVSLVRLHGASSRLALLYAPQRENVERIFLMPTGNDLDFKCPCASALVPCAPGCANVVISLREMKAHLASRDDYFAK